MVQVFSTLYMVGVIWFVQVVHYPLMAWVGVDQWTRYEQAHTRLTGLVLGPVMLAELVTAVALIWARPTWVSQGQAVAGLVLLGVVWLSTWGVQVPCHARLSRGFEAATHRWLVRSNWIRTVCWTARGGIVLGMAMGVWR